MVELQVKKLYREIHITHRGVMNKTCKLMLISIQVVAETQKMQALEGCHSDKLGGGHFGRDKSLAKIAERYYWAGMADDVQELYVILVIYAKQELTSKICS